MQTLEYVLATTALLAILGLLAAPIHEIGDRAAQTKTKIETKMTELACSTRADHATSYFTRTTTNGCATFPYMTHAPQDIFTLVLEGSNHYG